MAGKPTRLIVLAIALLAAPPLWAAERVTVPDPGTYVVDRADVLPPEREAQIGQWLRELEQKTTAQIKVLTVPTTGTEDIFTFSQRHFDLWKLGREDIDNGALIVLAPEDRKVRIHTGYGLEGILPDSFCGSLSREAAKRFFKQGQYGDGLFFMVVAVANRVADEEGVKLTGIPDVRHRPGKGSRPMSATDVCFVLLLVVPFLLSIAQRRRMRRYRRRWGGPLFDILFWGGMPTSRGSGWHTNRSGFGGGGFGGGFGGGSFGGGGMSGGGGGGASW